MLDVFFFFKQKTAYEVRISDWSSDVCSSDLVYFIALLRLRYIPSGVGNVGRCKTLRTQATGIAMRTGSALGIGLVERNSERKVDAQPRALTGDVGLGHGHQRRMHAQTLASDTGLCGEVAKELESFDRKSTRLNSSH